MPNDKHLLPTTSDCKFECLREPCHLLKYSGKGNRRVVLSFPIRQQATKEIGGIALLSTSHSPSDYDNEVKMETYE